MWKEAALAAGRTGTRTRTAEPVARAPSEDVLLDLCALAADYALSRFRGNDGASATWRRLFDLTAESRAPGVPRRALVELVAGLPGCRAPGQYLRELAPGTTPLSGGSGPVSLDRRALAWLVGAVASRASLGQLFQQTPRTVQPPMAPTPPGPFFVDESGAIKFGTSGPPAAPFGPVGMAPWRTAPQGAPGVPVPAEMPPGPAIAPVAAMPAPLTPTATTPGRRRMPLPFLNVFGGGAAAVRPGMPLVGPGVTA